jgi:hypothetical protein
MESWRKLEESVEILGAAHLVVSWSRVDFRLITLNVS